MSNFADVRHEHVKLQRAFWFFLFYLFIYFLQLNKNEWQKTKSGYISDPLPDVYNNTEYIIYNRK